MKPRSLIFALLAAAFITSLFAVDLPQAPTTPPSPTTSSGSYGRETFESLTSTGLLKLNRTTVTRHLSVNGILISQGATIGSIDVIGEANLTDTLIENGGTIFGYIQTHHASIKQPLIINGQKAVFTSSHLAGLTVRRMDAFKGKQIIELRQKTIVDGPISFESGKGEVHLYPGSQVLGPVSGGKIVKKS